VNKGEQETINQKRSERREGVYVRIVGLLKIFGDKRHIMSFSIRPIQDFNEITHHFLEVMYAHVYNTKENFSNGKSSSSSTQEEKSKHFQETQNLTNGNSFTPLQLQILQLLFSAKTEDGFSIQFLSQHIKPTVSYQDIKAQLSWLFSEGHVFPTIDDEHFAVPK